MMEVADGDKKKPGLYMLTGPDTVEVLLSKTASFPSGFGPGKDQTYLKLKRDGKAPSPTAHLGAAGAAAAEKMRGKWSITSVSRDGKAEPADELKARSVAIDGDTLSILHDGRSEDVPFAAIDPAKTPGTFDFDGGPRATLPGIYLLDGDTLTLAFDRGTGTRPANFDGGDHITVMKLSRQKAEKK
jgi:uncharacterized protein (TIGR03067 family)